MIKLLLNPSFRIGLAKDTAVLISELSYLEFPARYLSLLQKLQEPTDIDQIDVDEQDALIDLSQRNLIVNANLRGLAPNVATYWLARHYRLKFVEAQLNLGIQFVGAHADRYRELFCTRFPECRLGESDAGLMVCVTSDLLDKANPDFAGRPQLMIKVGGVKQSIGPILTPIFGMSELRNAIGRPFDADLSVPVPAGLQDAADGILLNELYHLRVQAGSHSANNHVIEWDMSRMKKRLWKVKAR